MASLTELFNPSFFMTLGIFTLFIALLVVYFETKMRDQTHKITTMVSLVSSLAEEVHNVKSGLYHLNARGGDISLKNNNTKLDYSEQNNEKMKLITVSDDEDSDSEEEGEDSESEEEEEEGEGEDSESEEDELEEVGSESDNDDMCDEDNSSCNCDIINDEEHNNKFSYSKLEDLYLESKIEDVDNSPPELNDIKVLKINIENSNLEEYNNNNNINDLEIHNITLDDLEDADLNINSSNNLDEDDKEINNEVGIVEVKNEEDNSIERERDEDKKKFQIIDLNNLTKTINIHLDESKNSDISEYKKMPLNKLRNIVTEKGLSSESSKLKKQDIFKLLGIE